MVDPTYIKISRMGKFLEIEGRREFTKGCGEKGLGKLLFNGYRVAVWGDKNISELRSGDGYTTLRIYCPTALYT